MVIPKALKAGFGCSCVFVMGADPFDFFVPDFGKHGESFVRVPVARRVELVGDSMHFSFLNRDSTGVRPAGIGK
jgi:hypothetical protein